MSSITGLGRSPGEGNGNPLQYSFLGNPKDRGAWRAIAHRITVGHNWVTRQQQKVFITVLFSMNKYYFHHFKKGKERREMTEPSSLFAYVIVFPPTEYWGLWSATSHFLPNLLLSWFHLHLLVRTKESVIGGASGMIEGRVGVRVGEGEAPRNYAQGHPHPTSPTLPLPPPWKGWT